MAKASERQKNRFYQIVGIGCLTFAVLSFVSLFSNSTGVVGEFVVKAIDLVAGEGKYVFPLVIAFLGVKMMMEWHKARFDKEMLVGVALLFALILVLLHLQLDTAPKDLYRAGIEGKGGGIIGGILAVILLTAFGRTGTYIILVALAVIAVMLTTNVSFPTMWKYVSSQAVMMWNRIRDMVSGFIFTEVEEDDEDTVPEVLPKTVPEKRRVLFDSSIFSFRKERDRDDDITVKAEEDDFPKINIYPEPIEKVLANEENRERAEVISLEERKTRSKKTESQKNETLQLSANLASNFSLPPLTLFSKNTKTRSPRMNKDITDNVRILEDTLESFGVKAKVTQVSRGPAITRYEIQPAPGVKVSRIVNLADDISLGLAASGVRIEAPIPGKAAVGIEVPNKEISVVTMRELLESEGFAKASSRLAFVLGKDIAGTTILADLAQMPHLLIAGATGSGKSVCMNTLIASILFRARPDEVKLLMIDPKMVELTTYNGIPHLISPVVTDSKKAATSLRWAVREMEKRYEHFARSGVKDIYRFNQAVKAGNAEYESGYMPFIMVVIDELADLMMVAPADVEDAICRLAQMARAAGMHLVVATQRPSVDVITGLIKANIPSRIAFAVSSQTDSRTILDMAGAEKLLGKGDMLFFPVGAVKPIRVQGAFMSDKEVEALVAHLKQQGVPQFEEGVIQDDSHSTVDSGEVDELFKEAVQILIESGQASISMLQRRLRIGYARAARLIDMMEERGIVGKYEGSKPRALLMTMEQFLRTFGDEP